MNIKTFYLGGMQTHCYLTWEKNTAYLFDCGGENFEKLLDFIRLNELDLKYIILTHGHGDHIAGINKLVEYFPNATLYIGREEKDFLVDSSLSLMRNITGRDFVYNDKIPVITISDGDRIGDFVVLDTPGHTIGSKCFYCKDSHLLISGDTMFRRSFGRYDLPTSSGTSLFKSLACLCHTLPSDTKVYSGHSEPTTIGEERRFLSDYGYL